MRLGQNREARANGLPVTLSAKEYCGISGLLTHEVHTLILGDPRDACALASELRRLLFEPLLQQRLVDAGLEFVSQYQWRLRLPRISGRHITPLHHAVLIGRGARTGLPAASIRNGSQSRRFFLHA